jgi:hypothetical protein
MRSNYFKVKDLDKFSGFLSRWNLELLSGKDELVGFTSEDGGIPSEYLDEASDEYVVGDFDADVAAQLEEGHVAIYREIGFEKIRYLVGVTVAVNHKGETRVINLDDIYDLARKELGTSVTDCSY